MLAHPFVRNDTITQWSLPINNCHHNINNINTTANLDDFVHIQDDQLPPDLLDQQHPHFYQQQPLDSPFQSPVHPHHFSSPLSSASSSPIFSSPAISSSRSPATAVSNDLPTVFDGGFYEAPSMSATSSFNPSIHIQHSTQSPFPHPQFQIGSPMLAQHGISSNNHGWDGDANIQLLSPARAQNGLARRSGFQGGAHKRASSGSSGTTDSTSPQAAAFNQQPNSSSFSPSTNGNGFTDSYQNSKKALPTPVQTPVQNSFLAAPFQNYDPSSQNGDNAEAERAMRQAVMEQQQHQQLPHQAAADEDASFQYSLAPSASSLSHHNSPVTPQTTYDDFDDGSKALFRGEDRSPEFDRWMDEYLQLDAHSDVNGQGAAVPVGLPKLNRTISDIYQDELYNAGVVPTPQVRKPNQNQAPLLPYRNLFADRLQAANQGHLSARSQSPANNSISRERSPFRQGSPLAADFRTARLQQSGLSATMQLPHTNGIDLGNQQDNQGEPKTISPKDALLEYHEGPDDASMPSLFPSTQAGPDYHISAGGDNLGLRRQSASSFQPTQNYSQMEAFPSQYAHQAAGLQQPFSFLQQQPQHNPRRQPQHHPNNLIQQAPEFPASLPTMESTASETTPAGAVQQAPSEATRRPDDTSSDSGTYTCTYHGCTLRFETPAKLQKHKREAHRQTTMAGHLTGRDGQGNPLAMRNSQAGPHKCERINPSTGKPCNSIFSRPYDLTRHEDTIHNARKQKVRCHLCTEEKTFSRNDALTRHMRVVHPDVDWPGKQRRKGRD